ncbi:MAG: DUF4872 domain-containing protein [Anaerolineaceae bacterium]|nr:DUF4872 domain-containing protein [Anaerolineaceae bacterium]
MPVLDNYCEFAGRHYETGTLRDALAWEGVRAPHSGEPLSEALLLGISGGIAFGYFTFQYQGYPPHLVLLTRNTFDPLPTLCERLAIPQDLRQTASANKGAANLGDALAEGHAAIVMADSFSLPWTLLPHDERNWAMTPLLVFGLDEENAWVAGPSSRPLVIPAATLAAARGRVKKERFRVTTLGAPDFSRLEDAVEAGLRQCHSMFTEGPPRGSANNFGLLALERWAQLLTNTRNKQSWARYFAPGRDLMMALAGNHTQPGAFGFIELWGFDGMERAAYADFLDEAAMILDRPALREVGETLRRSHGQWRELARMLLPDEVPALAETRQLLQRRYALLDEQGMDALPEMRRCHARQSELFEQLGADFPMTEAELTAFREDLAAQVLAIHATESEAMGQLGEVLGS